MKRIYMSWLMCCIVPVLCCLAADKRPYYFSVEVTRQVNPLEYYPLEVGTTWIYEHTYQTPMDASEQLITMTWESEETVLAHYEYPEGTLIARRISNRHLVHEFPEDVAPHVRQQLLEWRSVQEETMAYYFVRGNYLYSVPEENSRKHLRPFSGASQHVK
jgi:hypothetical protein